MKSVASFLLMAVVIWYGLSMVRADVQSGWTTTAAPQLQKTVDLPSDVAPVSTNRDCTQLSYIATNDIGQQSSASDCFVSTAHGSMGLYGTPMLYNNTSDGIGINGYQNGNYLVQPIPNQGMTLSLTSSSVLGFYAHFYTDIYRHVTANYNLAGGLQSYTVNAAPDFELRDKNGVTINFNPNTLAYSSNGSWMLIDAYARGFLRVNLATFEIIPFAQSLNGPDDYANHYGITAISDDGRYAVIGSNEFNYLNVYDLSTCTGTIPNDYSQQQNCQSRNYMPALSSDVNGYHAISNVRFVNDDNLNLTLIYNWHPTNTSIFDVAKFRLTAPGKVVHGLDYLAMGDSYISGQGEFVYKDGTDTATNTCHQSPLSYPYTIGAGLFNQYESVACSGATTDDVITQSPLYKGQATDGLREEDRSMPPILSGFKPGYVGQIEFVKTYQPTVITLSIGGNDINFADMLKSCVSPVHLPTSQTCFSSYDDGQRVIRSIDNIFPKLHDTYQAIMQADPGVRLYVIGYPQIAVQGNCADNVHLDSQEILFSQAIIGYLDWTIKQAADSTGARYVDTQDALAGSRLCEAKSSVVAINGVTAGNDTTVLGVKVIGAESFHPNVLGHQLIGQSVLRLTDNLTQPMPGATTYAATLPPNPALTQAILTNPTPSGNPVPDIVVSQPNLTRSITTRGATITLSADGGQTGLQPNSTYQVLSDSTTTSLGSVTSDADGNLSAQLTLPVSLEPGYHTILVTGKNSVGQTITLYELIYIAADGTQTDLGQCGPVELSGHDTDSDGIDDVCDPLIGDAPKYTYPVAVHLTGNSIQISNP